MDYPIEVITLPVSDVDLAVRFYTERAGFILDVDYRPNKRFRVVQLTPPGSSCSVQFGVGLTDATPGSARTIYLVVTDIEAAHRELTGRGSRCQSRGRSPGGSRGTRRLRQGRLCVFGGRPTLVGAGDRPHALLRRVRREPDHGRDGAQRRARRRALADRDRGVRGFRAANPLLAARSPDERRNVSTPLQQGVATRHLSQDRRRGRCGRWRRDPG